MPLVMQSMKRKKIISMSLMAASIVMMTLPYGVRMNFSGGPPAFETLPFYCSHFSGMPIGYGNWFPIITAAISILALIFLFMGAKRRTMVIYLSTCVIASLASWIIFGAVSVVGGIVFVLHAAALTLQIIRSKEPDSE